MTIFVSSICCDLSDENFVVECLELGAASFPSSTGFAICQRICCFLQLKNGTRYNDEKEKNN